MVKMTQSLFESKEYWSKIILVLLDSSETDLKTKQANSLNLIKCFSIILNEWIFPMCLLHFVSQMFLSLISWHLKFLEFRTTMSTYFSSYCDVIYVSCQTMKDAKSIASGAHTLPLEQLISVGLIDWSHSM